MPDYRLTFVRGDLSGLELADSRYVVSLAVVTRDARGAGLNLRAPILLNLAARRGAQIVSHESWPVRFPLQPAIRSLRKSA